MLTQESTQAAAAQLIKAVPATLDEFRCPICKRVFGSYDGLRRHYETEHPTSIAPVTVALNINGQQCEILIEPHWTLQRSLQFRLGLTGTKHMCNKGVCGSCTVIINGRAVLACTTLEIE